MKSHNSIKSVYGLAYLAVPLASFLTFMVQPLVGKHLLPWHGGSASTWVTSMVFFQAALLLGYGTAYFLQRYSIARQAWLLGGLAVLVPLLTRIPPLALGSMHGPAAVFLSLLLSLLPAIVLTTGLGILMHGWFRAIGGKVPYHLYSISNLGSLLALCSYPFWIEPNIGLSAQGRLFYFLLILLCLSAFGLSVWMLRWFRQNAGFSLQSVDRNPQEAASEIIPRGRVIYWFLLAASACIVMLGSTRLIAAEIGSNPVSWILPLGIYLLSFSITFTGIWREWMNTVLTVFLGGCVLFFIYHKGLTLNAIDLKVVGSLLGLLLCVTHLGHGLIYLSRPKERFAFFYVVIASGGVFGGVLSSFISPAIFPHPYEFFASILIVLGVAVFRMASGSGSAVWFPRLAVVVLVLMPSLLLLYGQQRSFVSEHERTRFMRNIYGQFAVRTDLAQISVLSETTLHGSQFHDEARRGLPTSYYHRGSPVGRILTRLQDEQDNMKIGIVGLGVGTLAAYGREGDRLVFWDINPLTQLLAEKLFDYIPNSPATVEIRMADGRIGVREADESFDLLVMDAFSGDSIPLHLMTREAIGEFLDKVPSGVLALHVSNRYIDLFPVLAAHAQYYGLEGLWIFGDPNEERKKAEAATPSAYFFFFQPDATLGRESIMSMLGEGFRGFEYRVRFADSVQEPDLVHWTDDRHAILDVLWR